MCSRCLASAVIVEYAAHPAGAAYVGRPRAPSAIDWRAADGRWNGTSLQLADAAHRPVRCGSSTATPAARAVRLHLHGEAGEYLPPRGHHRKVNRYWFEDYDAEFVNGAQPVQLRRR